MCRDSIRQRCVEMSVSGFLPVFVLAPQCCIDWVWLPLRWQIPSAKLICYGDLQAGHAIQLLWGPLYVVSSVLVAAGANMRALLCLSFGKETAVFRYGLVLKICLVLCVFVSGSLHFCLSGASVVAVCFCHFLGHQRCFQQQKFSPACFSDNA